MRLLLDVVSKGKEYFDQVMRDGRDGRQGWKWKSVRPLTGKQPQPQQGVLPDMRWRGEWGGRCLGSSSESEGGSYLDLKHSGKS